MSQGKHTASALVRFNLLMLLWNYENVDMVSCMGCITILFILICALLGHVLASMYGRLQAVRTQLATIPKGRHNRSHRTTYIPAQPHFSTRLDARKFPLN
jgi:hypothetical protein